jgi:DNA polymerase I-like protein with 3'-5' exonuclease and polymerase domains
VKFWQLASILNFEVNWMAGFAFGGVNVAANKKTLASDMIRDVVQIDHTQEGSPYYLVLLDELYPPQKLRKIKIFLERNGLKNYRAVCALNVDIKKDNLKGELSKFYRTNQSTWRKYAEGARAVFVVGAALYSVIQSTDLLTQDFYDIIFNKPYFWSPDAQAFVFPMDSFNEIMMQVTKKNGAPPADGYDGPANTYKTHFAEWQFKTAQSERFAKPWGYEYEASPGQFPQWAEKKLIPHLTWEEFQREVEATTPSLVRINSLESFKDWCRYHILRKHKLMAWDLETSSLDFVTGRIGVFTASFDGKTGYYVRWDQGHVDIDLLNDLLASVEKQVGANLKFDVRFLWRAGVKNAYIHEDTLQLGHLMNEARMNSLKSHAYHYTAFGGYDRELDRYREKTGIDDFTTIPDHIIFPYATMDSVVTYLVYQRLQKQLDWILTKFPNEKVLKDGTATGWNLRRYYEEIMMPVTNAFAEIEYRGVFTDREVLAASRAKILGMVAETEAKLTQIWGVSPDFDFNSAKELGVLFEKLGWEDLGRSAKGDYLTGDELLERWAQKGHEGASEMRRLRSMKAMIKTFISSDTAENGAEKGWEQYLRKHEDGSWRMHPTFNAMRTESGRCSSSNPNMQNVPAHGEFASMVKKVITTPSPEDYYLSTVDFASLQIRLAAIDSNFNSGGRDEVLYNVYLDPKMGGDLHSMTGHSIFAKGKEFDLDIIEVEDETGKQYTFFADEQINTKNRGKIYAKDLLPSDTL